MVKGNRMCKSWKNADDLAGKVSTSLDYQIKNYPRIGWVKADKVSSEEANSKLIKLREENGILKEQVNFLSSSIPKGTEGYASGNDLFTIHYTIPINPWDDDERNIKYYKITKTWDEIFLSVCTLLLKPIMENRILEQLEKSLLKEEYASMEESDFQTILIQLMALKLITTDIVKSEYDGVFTYWVLSPYGITEMTRLKAIKRNM